MMSLLRLVSFVSAATFLGGANAGLLGPILNPLLEVGGSVLSGQGIVNGVLGGIGGILGADQE